jgi:hypothetical protein
MDAKVEIIEAYESLNYAAVFERSRRWRMCGTNILKTISRAIKTT